MISWWNHKGTVLWRRLMSPSVSRRTLQEIQYFQLKHEATSPVVSPTLSTWQLSKLHTTHYKAFVVTRLDSSWIWGSGDFREIYNGDIKFHCKLIKEYDLCGSLTRQCWWLLHKLMRNNSYHFPLCLCRHAGVTVHQRLSWLWERVGDAVTETLAQASSVRTTKCIIFTEPRATVSTKEWWLLGLRDLLYINIWWISVHFWLI